MTMTLANSGALTGGRAPAPEPIADPLAELEREAAKAQERLAAAKAADIHKERVENVKRVKVLHAEIAEGTAEEEKALAEHRAAEQALEQKRLAYVRISGARFARIQPRAKEIGELMSFVRAHAPALIGQTIAELEKLRHSADGQRKVKEEGKRKLSNHEAVDRYLVAALEAIHQLRELIDAPLDDAAATKAVARILKTLPPFDFSKMEPI